MEPKNELRLVGVGASPYTRKLRGALRFRRLPFRFVVVGDKQVSALPAPPLPLLPYIVLPGADGGPMTAMSDTTPILNCLEEVYTERRLRPSDPALNLIDLLLEDYGDEWLSKCMFHYRWSNAADTKKASAYLPYSRAAQVTRAQGERAERVFADRQISRIGVVGSNPVTAPIIEGSWRRFLEIFEAHVENQPYLLGQRPGAGDFAAFGQMTMLVITDPTPAKVAMEVSPRAYAWTERLEDVSGLEVSEADWVDLSDPPATLHSLLCEVGRVYAPFMISNAKAVAQAAKHVECEIDGQRWVQESFAYQAKCLGWLRKAYFNLDITARGRVDRLLQGTGCEPLFTPA